MATRSCIIVVMYIWGEPKQAWSTGPHASTNQPTDRVRPIHVMLIPSRAYHATLMWRVQCVVVIPTRLRTPTIGKWKAETPAQRTARLERERETGELLHTCASLSVSPCILGFHVRQFFLPVTLHKPFFTLFYICAHCILDKTYTHTMHTDVDGSHPLALHATYNTAQAHPQRWSSSV